MKLLSAFALLCFLCASSAYSQGWTSTGGPAEMMSAVAGGTIVVSVSYDGVYLRTPSGWSSITPPGVPSGFGNVAVSGNTVFVSHYARGILRSTDAGATWTLANTGLGFDSTSVECFAVDSPTVYVGAYRLYKSVDNGLHWTPTTTGSGREPTPVSAIAVRGAHIYAGSGYYPTHGRGVFHSADFGAHWESLDSLWGVQNYFVYALALTDSLLYTSAYNGVFRRPLTGGSWTLDTAGLSIEYTSVTSLVWRYPVLFAGKFGGVASKVPGPGTWSDFSGGLVGNSPKTVRGMALAAGDLYAATDSLIWRLPVGTAPLVISSAPVTGPGTTTLTGTGASISFTSVGTAGSLAGALFGTPPHAPLFSSAAPGSLQSAAGLLTGPASVSSVRWVLTPTGLGTFSGEVRFSLTGLSRGISNPADITIYRRATPDSGQFAPLATSFNAGANELRAPVTALGEFVLGSNSNIFTGLRQPEITRPARFELLQNYPNPFNPATTIGYTLPRACHVTLTVHNMLGQKIAELLNADMGAGFHEVRFSAVDLASGVYFYRLSAGSFTNTKKLILEK